MALVLNEKVGRREHQCDYCRRVLGTLATGVIDARAGYVQGVGKRHDGVQCGGGRGCRPIFEHPLACSDVCEDKLLASWPRMKAEDVYADEWLPDFRDADVQAGA